MSRDRTIEEALHRALSAQADTVETTPDALGTIRGRIERRRERWWLPRLGTPRGLAMAAAAAAVVVAAGVAAVAAGWPADRSSPGPGASGVTENTASPAGTNLPIYYLGPSDRLYREYHVLPGVRLTDEEAVREAVLAMLDRPADDPDYHSPWPVDATVRSVAIDAGIITVDLAGAAGGAAFDATIDQLTAKMAVQQLVWTATASVRGWTGVRLLLDGTPATSLWGRAPASGVLPRGPAADVLGQIWIIDPQQGTHQGHRFDVNLAGIVFEATMRLRVLNDAGVVVVDQTVHLTGGAPAQGTAKVPLELTPGRYTIEGYVISAQDSSEHVYDDHQFTVG